MRSGCGRQDARRRGVIVDYLGPCPKYNKRVAILTKTQIRLIDEQVTVDSVQLQGKQDKKVDEKKAMSMIAQMNGVLAQVITDEECSLEIAQRLHAQGIIAETVGSSGACSAVGVAGADVGDVFDLANPSDEDENDGEDEEDEEDEIEDSLAGKG